MKLDEIITMREGFIKNVIPLQPSENYICSKARSYLSSDFQTRYSLKMNEFRGLQIDNAYAGASITELMIEEVRRLAMNYFNAQFVDVRPISGHLAAMQVLGNLLKKGERFLYVGLENGGYDGYQPQYLQNLLGIRGDQLPFSGWTINYERLKTYPKNYEAIVLGASIIFEPYDIKMIKEFFPDSFILYDASHVLSLFSIDGFQKDKELIDVVYGSTHKNFPGPQGGIIFGKSEFEEKVTGDVIWRYYDNFHPGRIASLGASIEFAERINYAENCLINTREFISQSLSLGLKLHNQPNVSKSCMVQLNYSNNAFISQKLEAQRILIDRIGRIGLNEVTSLGLKPKDVSRLPEIIMNVLHGNKVDEEVNDIIEKFNRS